MQNRLIALSHRWLALCLLLVAGSANAAVELLVPAYFYPTPAGSAWTTLTAAAQAGTPVTVIMNPATGPGLAPNADYVAAVNALRAAGGKVLGYVPTGYGGATVRAGASCQPAVGTTYTATDVLNCAARYKLWYAVDGVFLDELTNTTAAATPAAIAFYQQIYAGIKGSNGFAPNWLVVGNPGSETVVDYFADAGGPSADTLVVFENSSGYAAYTPAAWQADYPAAAFAHLVYAEASSANAAGNVAIAAGRNTRYLYVSNDVAPNPWDTLPPYFATLAQAVRDFNATHADPLCSLDLDANGSVDAATDGVLLLRALLGFSGNALTAGALGASPGRSDPALIANLVATMAGNRSIDVDRSNSVTAFSDGVMLLRMMLGATAGGVTSNAIAVNAQRSNWAQMRMHINAACGSRFRATNDPLPPTRTVGAMGDMAQCSGSPPRSPDSSAVAAAARTLGANVPLLLLGDLVYTNGTATEFAQCYDPIWGGALKAASYPVPGNHEYNTANAAPYYAYFGARAGDPTKGYYSMDIGGWHIMALNSNLPMGANSAQATWLRNDLLANASKRCKLAYWHHPRFSSSDGHGSDPYSSAIWDILYTFRTDVVLNGHDHVYERFAPQTPTQQPDARGIRQFVIGTGGAGLYGFNAVPEANSAVRIEGEYGLVRFDLRPDSYSWQTIAAAGSIFNDSGNAKCNL